MWGKADCCCLDRVQLSILHPGNGRRLHQGVAQHVVCREGGTRVLGRSRSRSCGESGSEDPPVRFRVAAARWCGVGGQVVAVIGAEVVAARAAWSLLSCRPSGVEVVHTRGSGTGVPFVMEP
jgi:hypothetical protein